MTTSLLISTYNSPQLLRLSLQSVICQTMQPDEILIADDGSLEDTRELIDSFRPLIKAPIKHLWHEDKGFRKSRILNKAIKECTSEYIVQIDGDIIMDPHFIEDHLNNAEKGAFITGSRTMVTQKRTEEAKADGLFVPHWYSCGISHRTNAIRIPFLSRFFHDYKRVNGCNMSFWTEDMFGINGYDEDIEGWGCEDNDIAERLCRLGCRKKHLKFSAVQYHLWHKHNSRTQLDNHKSMLSENASNNIIKCQHGLETL